MWLNFLPIYNKEKKSITFPDVRDVQHYMALYRFIAELNNKNAVIVKKRQIASSYYHTALLINKLWFFQGSRLKLLSYVEIPNLKTSWGYIVQYRDFLNSNTAWIRPFSPDKVYHWIQQIEVKENGIRTLKGLKSELIGKALSDNPTGGVGGGTTYAFYEEAGIAPTLDITYSYMLPAMKEGNIITGQFIAAGSVGSMDQCKPLQKYIYLPEDNDFFPIENNYIDLERTMTKQTGCFIPQQWGMKPFIDEYGNSQVEEAIQYLLEQRQKWKKTLSDSEYQIRVSQEPICLEEVFNYKKSSRFPLSDIKKHILKLESNPNRYKCYKLERDHNGKVIMIETNKKPILDYPHSPTLEDKEGCVQIFEPPRNELPFGTYIAGIDTVNVGNTTSSPSLASIYVMRDDIQIHYRENNEMRTKIEPSTLVCCWTGRFDELNKTNEQLLRILELYNAIGVVEQDVAFTQYVIKHKKVKHLLREEQFVLYSEQFAKLKRQYRYGWKNTGDIFNKHMIPYLIQYITEDFSDTDDKGNTIPRFGIERIQDEMVFKELLYYEDGYNTDRVIALTSAITYLYISQTNKGITNINKKEEKERTIWDIYRIKKNQQPIKSYFNILH